jgi:hypothetical protein
LALAGCATGGDSGGSGGSNGSGGSGSGGSTSSGGTTGSGGQTGSGGSTSSGGTTGTGGAAGKAGTGGTAGKAGTGGTAGKAGTGGTAGTPGTGGAVGDGGVSIDCSATFPTSGGNTMTGMSINGSADGLNFGIWTNGSGGSITTFPNAHAFSASWANSMDFLAHVGLDFNTAKDYTAYGTILADFSEMKSGNTGNTFSSIGIYGWMHSPCIEWYINEDSYSTYINKTNITAMIDGAMYYLSTSQTMGTGGANACETGHQGGWTNITATRATPRTCGTVTVSDHFASWVKQGWSLGTLASVHINVEVGGGTGSIQFPMANVTTTSK